MLEVLAQDGFDAPNVDEVEGERALLRRLLTLKFGPLPEGAATVLDAATEQQLETWAERVLTAASLEEILAS